MILWLIAKDGDEQKSVANTINQELNNERKNVRFRGLLCLAPLLPVASCAGFLCLLLLEF